MLIYCAECHRQFELDKKGVYKNGLYFCSKTCADKRFPDVAKSETTEFKRSESVKTEKIVEAPKPKKKATKKKISK